MDKKINRIKVMLVDRGKTNRWLATQLGKDPATISKWCTNAAQPTLETMMQIAKLLNVEMNDLVRFEALPDIPSLEENVTTSAGEWEEHVSLLEMLCTCLCPMNDVYVSKWW
ncbi:MAG: helix-turn-helix domain-containing protein [Phocaeicola sp.]|nr:helix-turn-helix domain-containing protein [Phocaeicola sp.]